jgi:hypothetical protein
LPEGAPLDSKPVTDQLSNALASHQVMTFVFFDKLGTDPDRLLDRWASEHLFKLSEWWVFGGRVADYLVGTPECSRKTSQSVVFGDLIVLESASKAIIQVGSEPFICVRLVWRTKGAIDRSYKVAAHLINGAGEIIAQYDSVPASYLAPTTTWVPEQAVIDQFGIRLSDDLPMGRYEVDIIVYDEVTGKRLPLPSTVGDQGSFPIGEIFITD